jgi:hypothetical protein
MVDWFENLSLIPCAILVIGSLVVLSLLFAHLVTRWASPKVLQEHNDLTGFIFAVVGVIYAVLLGFIAISVWERFASAEARTYDEASNLVTIYRDAGEFPNGARLRSETRKYAEDIIGRAWPAMARGNGKIATSGDAESLGRDFDRTIPRDTHERALYPTMVAALDEAMLDRDERVAEDATGLNGIVWLIVWTGGVITIAFTCLFGFRQTAMQTTMIGTLALLIGLVIFLMLSLDYPYRGTIRVGPDAFQYALQLFDRIDDVDPLPSAHT